MSIGFRMPAFTYRLAPFGDGLTMFQSDAEPVLSAANCASPLVR